MSFLWSRSHFSIPWNAPSKTVFRFLKKCLFIWLYEVLVVTHRVFIMALWLLSSCGMGWVAPLACGILVPRPGVKPESPALEYGFLTTGPPGKSLKQYFFFNIILKIDIYLTYNIWQFQAYGTVVQFHIYTHIYIHTQLLRFFSIISYYKILNTVPCAVQ